MDLQQRDFPRAGDELFRIIFAIGRFNIREQEWVVAALAQLHQERLKLFPVCARAREIFVVRFELLEQRRLLE